MDNRRAYMGEDQHQESRAQSLVSLTPSFRRLRPGDRAGNRQSEEKPIERQMHSSPSTLRPAGLARRRRRHAVRLAQEQSVDRDPDNRHATGHVQRRSGR